MVIVSFHYRSRLLEADVVKPGKRSSVDVLYFMIRYQEVFFPSHEHVVAFLQGFVIEVVRVEVLLVVHESGKLTKMLSIDFLVGVPLSGEKGILLRNNLPIEERRERGELEGQSSYFEVTAKV